MKFVKSIDRNLVYMLLPLGLAFVLLSFIMPEYKLVQSGLAFAFIYLYIGFSLLHHKEDKSLTLEVTLEYVLIATLTLILLLGVVI